VLKDRVFGWIAILTLVLITSACATTEKPCSSAGDVSWQTPIHGDRVCFVKTLPNGTSELEGKFIQYYPDGKIAVRGQFVDGKKDGLWTQYNEEGEKTVERYYDHGIEKMIPEPK